MKTELKRLTLQDLIDFVKENKDYFGEDFSKIEVWIQGLDYLNSDFEIDLYPTFNFRKDELGNVKFVVLSNF